MDRPPTKVWDSQPQLLQHLGSDSQHLLHALALERSKHRFRNVSSKKLSGDKLTMGRLRHAAPAAREPARRRSARRARSAAARGGTRRAAARGGRRARASRLSGEAVRRRSCQASESPPCHDGTPAPRAQREARSATACTAHSTPLRGRTTATLNRARLSSRAPPRRTPTRTHGAAAPRLPAARLAPRPLVGERAARGAAVRGGRAARGRVAGERVVRADLRQPGAARARSTAT